MLKFEQSPDPYGSPGDTSTCVWFAENGPFSNSEANVLGSFTSPAATGSGHVWFEHSVDVTSFFDPFDCHLFGRYASGNDFSTFRRVRVEGSDASVYYGEFPQGFAYDAADQDGYAYPASDELIGASGGGNVAVQWSKRPLGGGLQPGPVRLDGGASGIEGFANGVQFKYVHFFFTLGV